MIRGRGTNQSDRVLGEQEFEERLTDRLFVSTKDIEQRCGPLPPVGPAMP